MSRIIMLIPVNNNINISNISLGILHAIKQKKKH